MENAMQSNSSNLVFQYGTIDFVVAFNDEDLIILESQPCDINAASPHSSDSRINLNEMVICQEGEFYCEVGGISHHLSKNMVLLVPSRFELQQCIASHDAKILNISFSSRISKFFATLWNKAVYENKNNYIVLSDSDARGINSIWEVIKAKFKGEIDKYERKIIYMNLGIIFCKVLRRIDSQEKCNLAFRTEGKVSYRGDLLFQKFLELLSQTTPKRHVVSYYADKLSITANYLSVVCTKCSNKTVKDWIKEAAIEEVRSYLMQFNLSIKEVAERTGFENLSFFTRFVKKNFGCTPTEYRRRYK